MPIGAILQNNIPAANQTRGSKNSKYQMSPQEAKTKGYDMPEPAPEPKTCQFCGERLHYKGLANPFKPKSITVWLEPDRCQCDKAQAYWEKYDQEQERIAKEKAEAEERAKMQARIDRLLGKSGIKKRFLTRTFENFKVDKVNRKAYETAKAYAERFQDFKEKGDGLYFVGSFGTGKTHLAAAISLDLINKGIPVICRTLIDLLGEIRRTYDNSSTSEYEVLSLYKEIDLLVVDDLGKEAPSEWALATFYAILNERYEACLPTVITTNYNDQELINRLSLKGDRITAGAVVSRLHEICYSVEMNWKDRRGL
jgi:DNA replication protein DnaC